MPQIAVMSLLDRGYKQSVVLKIVILPYSCSSTYNVLDEQYTVLYALLLHMYAAQKYHNAYTLCVHRCTLTVPVGQPN